MNTRGALNRIPLAQACVPGLFILWAAIFLLPPLVAEEAGAGPLEIHTQTHQSVLPALPEARGPKGQSCAGSIAFAPASANPGDLVTITVTIAVNAAAVGRVDITTPGGTVAGSGAPGSGVYNHWWTVPASASGNLPISFVAYPVESVDLNPPLSCSGAASLTTPAALSVAVGGSATVNLLETGAWTATVSGGAAPYTFDWNLFGLHVTDGPTPATVSTQQRVVRVPSARLIEVTVTDANESSARGAFWSRGLSTQLAVALSCTAQVEVGDDASYYARVTNLEQPQAYNFKFVFSDGPIIAQGGLSAYGTTRTYPMPGTINVVAYANGIPPGYQYPLFGSAACTTVVIPKPTPGTPCGTGNCNPGQFCCHDVACCTDGHTCCGNGLCCPFENANCCGSGGCCPASQSCCGGSCCAQGAQCCPGAQACCPDLAQCCGAGCCPAGTYCCGDGQCCME